MAPANSKTNATALTQAIEIGRASSESLFDSEEGQKQWHQDCITASTSVATKIWGRWAMLNLVKAATLGQYILQNLEYGALPVFAIAFCVRGFIELVLLCNEELEKSKLADDKQSTLEILASTAYWQKVGTKVYEKRKKIALSSLKTATKFAVAYSAWSIATGVAKTLLAATLLGAFWQVTLAIIAAALVTALALAIVTQFTDRKKGSFEKGSARGFGEGLVWSFLEAINPYKAVGKAIDIMLVSIGVSSAYAASGATHIASTSSSKTLGEIDQYIDKLIDKNSNNLLAARRELKDRYSSSRAWLAIEERFKLKCMANHKDNPRTLLQSVLNQRRNVHRVNLVYKTSSARFFEKHSKDHNFTNQVDDKLKLNANLFAN